jgi:sulfur-oxidizing protein SoxZ
MAEITARITMPQSARRGDIVEIKVLARHAMDRAVDAAGLRPTPRRIVHTFRVRYGGEEVFRMDLSSGVASNPYVAFTTVATETGPLLFEWLEDGGAVYTRAATLVVT